MMLALNNNTKLLHGLNSLMISRDFFNTYGLIFFRDDLFSLLNDSIY